MTQVGSIAYMAPERLRGEAYSFDSDIWSVGVIVLEMLLGQHPYTATSFVAIFKMICDADPPAAPPSATDEQRTRTAERRQGHGQPQRRQVWRRT